MSASAPSKTLLSSLGTTIFSAAAGVGWKSGGLCAAPQPRRSSAQSSTVRASGAERVERVREHEGAGGGDPPFGRLQNRPGPQNAAGIRIEPLVSLPQAARGEAGSDGGGGARRGAAGGAAHRLVQRVDRGAVVGVLTERREREFRQRDLAEGDHAGGGGVADRRRVRLRRRIVAEQVGAGGGHGAGDVEEVLPHDRHAVERTVRGAGGVALGAGLGLGAGALGQDGEEDVGVVVIRDGGEESVGDLDRVDLPGRQAPPDRRTRLAAQRLDVRHRRSSPSAAGSFCTIAEGLP